MEKLRPKPKEATPLTDQQYDIVPICKKHFSELYMLPNGELICGEGGERIVDYSQIRYVGGKKHLPS